MKKQQWVVAALAVAALAVDRVAWGGDELPVLWRFESSLGDNTPPQDFSRWGGKPLSPETVTEKIPPVRKEDWGGFKWLPTGAKDRAVVFAATNTWQAGRGAFSLWVTGKGWDLAGPVRETLVIIEGDDATVSLERSTPGMLSVVSSKGGRLDAPFQGDPNALHFIVVNYDAGQVTLFLDALEAGSGKNLSFPAQPKRLVFGQLGEGPGLNKYLERLVTYQRPLTKGDIAVAYYAINPILDHVVTIPHVAKPIVIDGIMDDAAWKDAAVLAGMTSAQEGDYWHYGKMRFSEVEDRIYLAYDDKYLYVGYHNPAPKQIRGNPPMVAAMMKVSKTGYDTNVDADDCFGIRLRAPTHLDDLYLMHVNYANTHYDYTVGLKNLKGININWNPAWISKSTLDMDGWHLECAIPLDGFEQVPAPKAGDAWHMTFFRIWKTTLEGFTWWAAGARTRANGEMVWGAGVGDVRFGGDQPVIARLLQVGDLNAGQVDLQAELVNKSAAPQKVTVTLTANSGELKDQQEVTLAANERKPYAFKGRIVDFSTTLVRLAVKDAAGTALFVHELPVVRSDKIDVYAFNYPSFGLVRYEVGCLALARYPDGDLALAVTARDAKGKKVFSQKFQGVPDYRRVVDVPMKTWPAGAYAVSFVFSEKGRTLAQEEVVYQKKPLPAWYGNRIGCDEEHPAFPWSDVQANTNQVNIWGRQYEFGGSLLPERIQTQGRALLRGPMTLSGETAEKGAFTSSGAKTGATLTRQNNCRVEGERWLAVPGLSVTNAWWAEYDGFCWVKLVLTPEQPVNLKNLTLTIPFTKEFSDVMNCSDYSIRKNDLIPPQGGVTHSPSLPIWVGNAVGGLQFFVDNPAAWKVKDLATSIRLENGPEGATLKVAMVDTALTLTNSHELEFGFTVTPVKELNHRKLAINPMANWSYGWFPNSEWMPGHRGWFRSRLRVGGSYIDGVGNRRGWIHGGPYTNLNIVHCRTSDTEGNADVLEFGDEWSANEAARFRLGGSVSTCFHSPSFRDWVVWKYDQLFLNSPYRCMYHDVSGPVSSANPFAHAGSVNPDGSRTATVGILGIREVYKRFYNIIAAYYPDAANSVFHSSGMPNMSYMSFGGRFWTDENLNSRINDQQPTYRGLVTPARFRAEYLGRNLGNYSSFIGQGRISVETCWKYGVDAIWDHLKGLCLLHDMEKDAEGWYVSYYYGRDHGSKIGDLLRERDAQALVRHDIYAPEYDFVGYWDQKAVTVPNTNTYVSLYSRVDKQVKPSDCDGATGPETVLIVCNESDWKGEMRLDVDWKALGFDPAKPFKAESLVHRVGLRVEDPDPKTDKVGLFKKPAEAARVEGGQLVFPITEWNYRMIAVTQ